MLIRKKIYNCIEILWRQKDKAFQQQGYVCIELVNMINFVNIELVSNQMGLLFG